MGSDEVGSSSEGLSSEEILRELKEVLKSEHFKNSGKLSHLLEYVCNAAIAGNGKQLNEYLIGVEVFERRPDFSASADSIVRVRAHDLRRRLREYYSTEGKDHPIQIVLPKGSYCPEFLKTTVSAPSNVTATEAAPAISPPEALPAVGNRGNGGFRLWPLFYVMAAILVFSLVGNVLTWRALRKSSRTEPPVTAQELAFYHELFGPLDRDNPRTTTINLSNPKVMFKFVSRSPNPTSYLGREPQPLDSELGRLLPLNADDSGIPYRPGDSMFYFLHVSDDEYTGMGEAACAFHLARLFHRLNRPAQLSQARFLTWEKAGKQDVILLGQPLINIWAEKNLAEPNFSYVAALYRNRHPEPGEQTVYKCEVNGRSTAEGFIDYGLILMQTLPNKTRVLTLSGACSYGTLGTGEFFCDAVKMRPVYEALKKRSPGGVIPAEYEILVKVVIKENIPVDTSLVACRAGRPSS
ncbi:MAG: hypothetical protein EHM23_16090 [Acidobacteria bacterium]|nr:MAG: hypothetical protein EHM23_16090 [Acidobacteriota bacterium]